MVKYFIAGVILFLFSCNQKTSSENEKEKIINIVVRDTSKLDQKVLQNSY